jgi:hypothetical protein
MAPAEPQPVSHVNIAAREGAAKGLAMPGRFSGPHGERLGASAARHGPAHADADLDLAGVPDVDRPRRLLSHPPA